ncbi:MAG: vitamin B12 transporter, partial [Bacteroidia bacterium]
LKTLNLDTFVLRSSNIRYSKAPEALAAKQIAYSDPVMSLGSSLRANLGLFTRNNGASGLSTLSYKGVGSMQTPIVLEGANMQSSMNGMMDLNLIESFHFDQLTIGSENITSTGTQNMGDAISLAANRKEPSFKVLLATSTQRDKDLGLKYSNKIGKWMYSASVLGSSSPNRVNLEHYGIDSFQTNTDYKKFSGLQKISFANSRQFSWSNTIYVQASDRAIPPQFYTIGGSRQQDRNLMMVNAIGKMYKSWELEFINQTWHETINFDDVIAGKSYLSRVLNVNSTLIANKDFNKDVKLRLVLGNENAYYTSDAVQNDARWNRLRGSYTISKLFKKNSFGIVQQVLVYDSAAKMTGELYYKRLLSKKILYSTSLQKLFRLPTLNELYWYQPGFSRGNPLLKPEEGYRAEMSLKVERVDYNFTVTPYAGFYQNWIQWGGASEFTPKNLQSVLVRGAILNTLYHLVIAKKDLTVKMNLNWTKATYLFDDKKDLRDGKQIIFTPELTGNLFIGWSSNRFGVHVNQYFASANYIRSDNLSSIAPYTLTDVGAFYIYREIRIGAALSNALNQAYFTQPRTPLPGRIIKININYTLKFKK